MQRVVLGQARIRARGIRTPQSSAVPGPFGERSIIPGPREMGLQCQMAIPLLVRLGHRASLTHRADCNGVVSGDGMGLFSLSARFNTTRTVL